MVLGAILVFDVVATLGGVLIGTLGGGIFSTLVARKWGGGVLGWHDIMSVSIGKVPPSAWSKSFAASNI
jgi:hypothetical protein